MVSLGKHFPHIGACNPFVSHHKALSVSRSPLSYPLKREKQFSPSPFFLFFKKIHKRQRETLLTRTEANKGQRRAWSPWERFEALRPLRLMAQSSFLFHGNEVLMRMKNIRCLDGLWPSLDFCHQRYLLFLWQAETQDRRGLVIHLQLLAFSDTLPWDMEAPSSCHN